MFKTTYHLFDKLEDKVRGKLSHYPIFYAFVGGVFIVLFWRGVWHIADDLNMSGTASIFISVVGLLASGLFVASFIGDHIIISGVKQEKKLTEKTEREVVEEEYSIQNLHLHMTNLEKQIEEIKEMMSKR